jgi:hypothetical protein
MRLETNISWRVKCAEGFVCWRGLCLVLSVRSALAEMSVLFMIIIKRQNKFFDDIMVVKTCDLVGKVQITTLR